MSSSSSNVKRGPKGPSAYNEYVKEELPKIKEEFPEMTAVERLKECAKRWQALKAEKQALGALIRFAEHAEAAGSTPEAFEGFETAVMEPPTVLAAGEVPSEEEKEEDEDSEEEGYHCDCGASTGKFKNMLCIEGCIYCRKCFDEGGTLLKYQLIKQNDKEIYDLRKRLDLPNDSDRDSEFDLKSERSEEDVRSAVACSTLST